MNAPAPPPMHLYQRVAVTYLRSKNRCGLFLEPGLGKTRCCIEAIEDRHLPVLVVAPPKVAEHTWHTEVAKWRPELTVARAVGGPQKRAEALDAGADITTISMNSLADLISGKGTKKEPFVLSKQYGTVIIDEVSKMKGRGSWWFQSRGISSQVDHVWGLTGSPASNGLEGLWAIVYLFDKGKRLGHNISAFRKRWFNAGRSGANGVPYEWFEKHDGVEAEIWEAVEDIALSMKAEGLIDLPPVTYNWIDVPLPAKCVKPYREMKKQLATDLTELFDSEVLTANNAAIATSKLAQMCGGFTYVNDQDLRDGRYTWMHNERIDALKALREEIPTPLLVSYEFKPERDAIMAAFPDALGPDEPDLVDRWNAGDIPMLVSHPGSISHGLNLQSGPGHTLAMYNVTWDLEAYEQLIGRLARQGQQSPVVVHHLVSPGTIDVLKRQRLEEKADVQNRLMEHLLLPI